MAMSYNFLLTTGNSNTGFVASSDKDKNVSNNNTENNQPTALTSTDANCVMDGFAGKDISGTFDMSKVTPEMIAGVETAGSIASSETAGSIASIETIGSVASAETAGSIAFDGGGGFDGGSDGGFSSFG